MAACVDGNEEALVGGPGVEVGSGTGDTDEMIAGLALYDAEIDCFRFSLDDDRMREDPTDDDLLVAVVTEPRRTVRFQVYRSVAACRAGAPTAFASYDCTARDGRPARCATLADHDGSDESGEYLVTLTHDAPVAACTSYDIDVTGG